MTGRTTTTTTTTIVATRRVVMSMKIRPELRERLALEADRRVLSMSALIERAVEDLFRRFDES